jgi:hypothetical protein
MARSPRSPLSRGHPVEAAFLAALHAEPNGETTWLALADRLEA